MNASVPPFPPQTDGGNVTHEELRGALRNGSIALVDVRETNEFVAGRIPGAINLPLSTFDPAQLPKGKPIVLVCQAGGRSAKALRAAVSAGVKDVRHYPGGTGGWRNLGEPIET
jgi:rhodanese-related sulfurtransferase